MYKTIYKFRQDNDLMIHILNGIIKII